MTADCSMGIDLLMEIAGALIGLTYLYLEYKAHIALWFVGILMSLFYIYIFFTSHFYADFGVYVYYLGANIYGLVIWLKKERKTAEGSLDGNPVTRCPRKYFLVSTLLFVLIWSVLWAVLTHLPGSASPIGDSFTTALSVIAMWLMAQKYIEHWVLWFVINVVSSILYITKDLYPTAGLFAVYTVMSVLGYIKWKQSLVNVPR